MKRKKFDAPTLAHRLRFISVTGKGEPTNIDLFIEITPIILISVVLVHLASICEDNGDV